MSNQRDKKKIEWALIRKGFSLKSSHHKIYHLHYQNKKNAIFTKISHGCKTKIYNDSLLSLMCRQLKLTKSELLDLIDCPLDYDSYIKKLVENGYL